MQTWLLRFVSSLRRRIIYLVTVLAVGLERIYLFWKRARAWARNRIHLPNLPFTTLQRFLILYFIFGLIYAFATPIFEASDELWHFGVVEHLARSGELPVQDVNDRFTIWRQEGSQPPLYYALSAFIVRWINLDDVEQYRQPNPHVMAGIPGNVGNKNLVLPNNAADRLSGTSLAVMILRVMGLLMGMVTIWGTYAIARLVFAQRPVVAPLAAAITAFNPMFLFISASVNNDTLVIMLNTLAIYLSVWMLRNGFAWHRSLMLAIVVALATLTKLSALVLVPVIAVAALLLARKERNWRGVFFLGISMLVAWLVIAGWWYLRNLMLYGELFGTHMMAQIAGPRTEPFTIATLLSEFEGFRISYWGLFGAVNIQAAQSLYVLFDLYVFLGLFGALFLVLQLLSIREFSYARRELIGVAFLSAVLLVGLLAFVNWTAQTYASQGRLLFPFMGAISPLLAAGLVEIFWWLLFGLRSPERSFVRASDAVPDLALGSVVHWHWRVLGLIAFVIPFSVIAPNYAAPQPIEELPDNVQPVYARFGDFELVGVTLYDERYYVGDAVPVTLYWRVIAPSERDYSLSLALLGPDEEAIGKIDTYPGAGTLRTSTWKAGMIYPDAYLVSIRPHEFEASYKLRMQVAWWDMNTNRFQPIIDETGSIIEAVLLDVGALIRRTPPDLTGFVRFSEIRSADLPAPEFGRFFRLEALRLAEEPFTLSLIWDAIGVPDRDYTSFVHVVDANGQLVGQRDLFPSLPTRYWRPWDRNKLNYVVEFSRWLAPGQYTVLVGWYENDGQSFPRLSLPEKDGRTLDAYPLFTFEVSESGEYQLETLKPNTSNNPAMSGRSPAPEAP